jgi:hypothetical protein
MPSVTTPVHTSVGERPTEPVDGAPWRDGRFQA